MYHSGLPARYTNVYMMREYFCEFFCWKQKKRKDTLLTTEIEGEALRSDCPHRNS